MAKNKGERRWGLRGLAAAVVLVCGLLIPAGATAFTDGTTYSLEIKVLPSKFKSGTQLDIPVYLVENRSPRMAEASLPSTTSAGSILPSVLRSRSFFSSRRPRGSSRRR